MRRIGVGIIGCGNIFPAYARNLAMLFAPVVNVRACADIDVERARARAEEFGVPKACAPDELLADPDIELVVNLTVPAAHYAVTLACLEAGKHVFAEKPLTVTRDEGTRLVREASARDLRLGGAADTFLGGGLQACRRAIDEGRIGTPLMATAIIAMGVHRAVYHTVGIGPMFDMGPYYLGALATTLGPAVRATGSAHIPFPAKSNPDPNHPEFGVTYRVETPTVVSGVLDFANGCLASVTTTTEVFGYFPRLEFYGTEGVLTANDPNMYGGPVTLRPKKGDPVELPTPGFVEKGRGLGVAEMAYAIATGEPHRANGEIMYHVLDMMHAFHDASRMGAHVTLESTCARPAPFDPTALLSETPKGSL